MTVAIKLDPRGIAETLSSAGAVAVTKEAAEQVARNVRSQGIRVEGEPGDIELPVEVSSYVTEQAEASVSLAHPAGLAVQAKHGALTKAAAQVGLDVKEQL